MSGISIALLVFFIIVAFLIVGLVLLQNEEGDSLGGLFSGGSNSAFGSKSSNVLTRATYVVVALFFVTTFLLALITKSPSDSGLSEEALKKQTETSTEWWKSDSGTTDNADGEGKKDGE